MWKADNVYHYHTKEKCSRPVSYQKYEDRCTTTFQTFFGATLKIPLFQKVPSKRGFKVFWESPPPRLGEWTAMSCDQNKDTEGGGGGGGIDLKSKSFVTFQDFKNIFWIYLLREIEKLP